MRRGKICTKSIQKSNLNAFLVSLERKGFQKSSDNLFMKDGWNFELSFTDNGPLRVQVLVVGPMDAAAAKEDRILIRNIIEEFK